MEDWKKDRIGSCVRGENPTMIIKMKSGFAVMADNQFLPGYCILLRYPKVDSLTDLSLEERGQYLIDTTLIGDAINKVCRPRKINYSTLMNKDYFLHTHIEARYDWESDEYKYRPSWIYPENERFIDKYTFNEIRHGDLKQQLYEALNELMKQEGY
jgi:diadenosine tetraphosphate (Ap4A) HIT family hydrolase